ncbi:hypothetical protein PQO01_20470 [Lentisphaera marina]|uniref:hypothetical protein n=1 Tax=Lentisphaera marina TaxID=1111041 RepID=UPI00236518C1|nr:hypothetical protein [Lentisphaera marina]MDD7987334.1 hypothetical protein [Lentisphaera marina]
MSEKKSNTALVIITMFSLTGALLATGFMVAESINNQFIFFPFLMAAGIVPTVVVKLVFYSKRQSLKKLLFTIFEYRFLNQHTLREVKREPEKEKDLTQK